MPASSGAADRSPTGPGTTPLLLIAGLRSAIAGPFSLLLPAATCVAITGPSGSGKSLFLRMVADLDPGEGEVALRGVSRTLVKGPRWRREVGYVAAEAGWWADLVRDHVASASIPALRALASRLGLSPAIADAPVDRLSTGERQRLAIARALVLDPAVLLLDEPTSALDAESVGRVETVLRETLSGGTAMLLVTHDEALAERMGTMRLRMSDRKLVAA